MAEGEHFKTAPKEVIAYFDRRPSVPTWDWRDIAPREHALAYTAAKTAGYDVVEDLRAATRKAVVDRVPWEEFRDGLVPKLRAKGWWGEKKRVDPATGEIVKAQLGSLRRLKLIYDANIRSAEAAGDWARIQEVKEVLPYLEYAVSVSERKRPEHLSWVGTTLPVDDPWWRTHYPPNGWNCKCSVRSRAVPREGLPPEKLRRPPLDLRSWTNKRTGESRLVPKGIDPGWESNPGLTRQRMVGRALVDRLDAMKDADARREVVRRLRADPVFRYVAENGPGFDWRVPRARAQEDIGRLRWPVAVISDAVAESFLRPGKSRVVTLSVADAAKVGEKHGINLTGFPIQQALDAPELAAGGGKIMHGVIWRGKRYAVIIKRSADDELFLNSIHRMTDEQWSRLERDAAGGA